MECTLPKDWFLKAKLCPHGYPKQRTENPTEMCEGCEYLIKPLIEIKVALDDRIGGGEETDMTLKIAKGNVNKVILDYYPDITVILSEKTYQHLCQDYIDRMLKSK